MIFQSNPPRFIYIYLYPGFLFCSFANRRGIRYAPIVESILSYLDRNPDVCTIIYFSRDTTLIIAFVYF